MANAKKKTKAKKQALKKSALRRIVKLAVVAMSVYLVISFISGQVQVAGKQRQLDELDAKVEQQANENKELERLMASGNEDAYIERIAREKLNYARPDERIYIDISGQ